ncbi:hypothetical protein [Streptomyces griseomycini]|uniref:Uncharacterized protein n=1 Tax=Streptomyces griseomycini TaxID=66895 RepID=A0A7W7PWE2_9ACTN|nr:hypothetical protein [Streptomyces griseomycini]MBB4902542.1 hypothetical protein [Streptomyces griseomycini]GGR52304.1 hypothetical protein GCM10015536_67340 [Streptomyces griseomycini]
MRKLPGKLKLVAYALVLLALAHPGAVPPVLGIALAMAGAVIGWALAHLSLALTLAAGVLLFRAFPGIPRWFSRSWDASVDSVLPVKA